MKLLFRTIALAFLVPAIVCASRRTASAEPSTAPADDTCLMFAATNLAKGDGNFLIYVTFAEAKLKVSAGDVLEYAVYLDPTNPLPRGGIDVDPDEGKSLRDQRAALDQNGLRAHGDADLSKHAAGQWYLRRIALDPLAGKTTQKWNLVFEGDKPGRYVQFIDDVVIVRADGSRTPVYLSGAPQRKHIEGRDGYSQHVLLTAVSRAQLDDPNALAALINSKTEDWARRQRLAALREEVEVVSAGAKRLGDAHLAEHAGESLRAIEKVEGEEAVSEEEFQAVLHQVNGALNHEHPQMRKFTGHLVGHAHIDFQWLWEWPETIDVCKQTFGQAVKFMAEFPQFKFSQSSSALYAVTEEKFPELFKEIQKYVASGQWEIVGGRVCEGDEHMISHESHARQFLYGQRYFRERFGKTATVGWEPDTFGHTWQMPQILKLGGCNYFYFCRGGKKTPMFWWEAPDGSRVLAFEEPATGGWYNGDVTKRNFDRLFRFDDKLGFRDMLWVYGVGNHGGGPTRENIETALEWMKKSYLPNVKFSTATEFFETLSKNYDTSKLPVIRDDLNTTDNAGFYGTYTSHTDIKRWNRDAEAATESAEAIAAFAAQFGFKYPRAEFRKNWEDICWNHHHDTLPGTSIHASYNLSEKMYLRVIESSRKIAANALRDLKGRVEVDARSLMVFNLSGGLRSGITNSLLRPVVTDLPSMGYRIYPAERRRPSVVVSDGNQILENDDYRVTVDLARGIVTGVFDKRQQRECVRAGGTANRLEVHWEEPDGMSAWSIGRIGRVEPLDGPVKLVAATRDAGGVTLVWDRTFRETTIRQTVCLPSIGPPEFSISTEWKELGSDKGPSPFLKVAFDVNVDPKDVRVTYQIPFGTIEKPAGGKEYPALKFVDLSDADGSFGAALINDCKHGYSAEGNTLRMSLIRSSYNPDKTPNTRPQTARWVFMPHTGSWQSAGVDKAAEAFNHPLMATVVSDAPTSTTKPATAATTGPALPALPVLPAELSFLSVEVPNVIVTGVKLAEDDDDLVVRMYEAHGEPAKGKLRLAWKVKHAHVVNFVEDELDHADVDQDGNVAVELRPHEIRTFKLTLGAMR